jgi:DtxR family Mn-dependent transcriptional regulator
MPSENVEEYLECIYELTEKVEVAKTSDIASAMKVTPASVTEMLQRLGAEGYVEYEKYRGAKLTQKGMEVARKIKRKHRLLERFLVDIVGVSRSQSHEEACRLEHVVSDESVNTICQLTNNPRFCPDGQPIPECEHGECASCETEPAVSLVLMPERVESIIVCLKGADPKRLRRLISMGFVPGRKVTVEERVPMGGPMLIKLERTRIALATEYAEEVMVRPTSGKLEIRKGRRRRGWRSGDRPNRPA